MWIGFTCLRIRSDGCIQQRTFSKELFSRRVTLKVVENNNNSILCLFTCLLESARANYEARQKIQREQTHTNRIQNKITCIVQCNTVNGDAVMRRIDLFLGNDCDTNNKTTAVARQLILNKQQFNYNNRGTVGKGVFYSISALGLYKETGGSVVG